MTKPLAGLLTSLMLLASAGSLAQYDVNSSDHDALRDFLQQHISDDKHSFADRFDAEVWLLSQSTKLERYIKNPTERLSLLKAIHFEASQANLNPDVVLAVIQVESAFDQYAVSRVGAQGLMQVMPFWKKELGRGEDNLTHALTNLRYGCRILQHYLQREKGNLMMALARYNGSYPKTWYSERVMDAWKDRWDSGQQSVVSNP
ncbi:MAG TPA: lytic transglycosylase domain-containing protein [Pseudomonadales bacterium]